MKNYIILLSELGLTASNSTGQFDNNTSEFRNLYNSSHKQLTKKYTENKEIIANITVYKELDDNGNKTDLKNTNHTVKVVTDGNQIRLFFEKSTDPEFESTYRFKTNDAFFHVTKNSLQKWSTKYI